MDITTLSARNSISNKVLYIVSLDHFVNDGSTFLVASLFPAMELSFGFSTYLIGLLVALGYLVNMILQPIVGIFSQKLQPRYLLAAGISIMAFSMGMFTLSVNFPAMLTSILVLRFGSSFFHPVGALAVSRRYKGEALDRSMGFESAFGNLGIVFAFVMSAPVYLNYGWKGPFILYGAIEIAAVVITLISIRDPASRITPFRNTVNQERTDRLSEVVGRKGGKKYVLGLPLFFVVIGFISGGSNAIFGNFGNLILYHSGFSFNISNDLMAAWIAFAFVGAIATGWLTKKMGRMKLLALTFLISGISTLAFSSIHAETYLIAIPLLVTGFTIAITYPVTYSELSDFTGSRQGGRGAEYGVLFSSQIAGAAILGYLGGFFSNSLGLDFSFAIAAGLLLLCAVTVLLWSRFYRKATLNIS